MLIRCVLLSVAALYWSSCAVSGDTKTGKLTSFRPISQAEYEAILSLTDGETVVSEGRLINGGLAALAGLTSGWVTSLRFPNIFGSFGSAPKSTNASYPLCVIRTEEAPGSEHNHEYYDHHGHHGHRQRRSDENDSHESLEHDDHHYAHQHLEQHGEHSNEDVSGENDSSIEMLWNTNKLSPVVNCIVVLREDEPHDDDDHYHHTTTKRPRRKRRKHRPHPILLPVPPPPPPPSYQPPPQYPPQPQPPPPPPSPPSPTAGYSYSAAQGPYSVGPPPLHGSYNNPWYWQTPQYSPYYREPPTYAGIYPPAYPDIYATSNPSPYTRNYPGTYSGTFASPFPSNNPSPYYDTPPSSYPDPPTSAYPGDSYNPQSSSYPSDYPNMEVPLNRENSPLNSALSYNYGPPSHDHSVDPTGQLHYSQNYDEHIRESHNFSAKSKKSASDSKVPTKTHKQKPKRAAKPRSPRSSATTKGPIRRKHTKAKRDESGIQTRSYAKIANYSESGYQPTLYPQNNYQSNYPKVSYTHALSYPAPVYVRNSIDQPTAPSYPKQYKPFATDSDNDGNQSGYIQATMLH